MVGGPAVTPTTDSFWQQVSGAMYLSRLTGGAPERYSPRGEPRYVNDWPSVNLATRKEVFLSVGGFDCQFWPGEDTFLCDKLTMSGIQIWYEPRLVVWHHRRESPVRHLQQVGNYGLHRGFFAKRYGRSSLKLAYFAPSMLVLIVLLLVVSRGGLLTFVASLFVATYFVTQIAALTQIWRLTGFRVAIAAFLYAFASHFWYGIRFLQGLVLTRELVSRLR